MFDYIYYWTFDAHSNRHSHTFNKTKSHQFTWKTGCRIEPQNWQTGACRLFSNLPQKNVIPINKPYNCTEMQHMQCNERHTVNVLNDVGREAVPRQSHQHLGCTFPPRHVVSGTPAGDSTEQKCQVILASQFFSWRWSTAQPHQYLHATTTLCQQVLQQE